jgi:hypothetical protein
MNNATDSRSNTTSSRTLGIKCAISPIMNSTVTSENVRPLQQQDTDAMATKINEDECWLYPHKNVR